MSLHAHTSQRLDGGPVVLLIHGFGSTAKETWVDSGWTRTLEESGIPWIAADLPEHGQSRGDGTDAAHFTPGRMLTGLLELLDAHGVDSVSPIGYSFGGELALRFASAFPARTARVVVGGVRAQGLFTPQAISDIRRHLQTGAGFEDPLLGEAWAATEATGHGNAAALLAFATGASTGPRLEEILTFDGPVLLFRGSEDPLADSAEAFGDGLRSIEELVVPGRHHRNTLTARVIRTRVVEFLAEERVSC